MSTFQETLPEFSRELRELCERYLAIIQTDNCVVEFGTVDEGQMGYNCNLQASYNGVNVSNLETGEYVEVESEQTVDPLSALGIHLDIDDDELVLAASSEQPGDEYIEL